MKRIFLLTTAVAGMLMAATGCHKTETKRAPTEPEIEVALPVVDSVTLTRTLPGYIAASSKADVVVRVSGTILKQYFTGGQYVKEGQPLYQIESTQYADAVSQAEAQLASAQSQYEYYTKQNEAMERALAKEAVSAIEAEQVKSEMQQAQATIKNAKAALRTAQDNLAHCTVRAPISGHITVSNVGTGSYVDGAGQAVKIAEVYADEQMEAVFDIESAQYEKIMGEGGGINDAIYRAVPISFEVPMAHSYTTDLYYSAPSVDQNTGTITIRGYIKNQDNEVKNGMYVSIALPYGTEPHAIMVKDASIGTDQLGKFVYVVDSANRVVYTPIQVGDTYQDTLRIVEKGLKPTDRYVTKALLTVRNGETVKPVLTK